MEKKINVLIVDDSAVVRQKLQEILSSDPEIEIIGTAANPYIAVKKIEEQTPDVITLDVEMPEMDGLTFLQRIMSQHPIPVIICSNIVETNSNNYLRALQYGAVDIIQKPKFGTRAFFEEYKMQICDSVKAAAKAHISKIILPGSFHVDAKHNADVIISKASQTSTLSRFETTDKVIAIGASTGGTEALRYLLPKMPIDIPGIVIVQHMPEHFTKSFANSLDPICKITVKEAENNDSILRGQALIAPGNYHLLVKRSGARYYVEVREGPLVNRHRPSVDVLFRSVSRFVGSNALAVILTGMGDDGAQGINEIKQAGGRTIAQDEASCVVFGMPKKAIETGGVDRIVGLEDIPRVMSDELKKL